MNRTEIGEIRTALRHMRSGDPQLVVEGERLLMRLAILGPSSACSCPNWPEEQSRDCWAHTYITTSVVESIVRSDGTSMRDVATVVRRAIELGEKR